MDDLTIEGISNWPNVPGPVKPATPVKPYEEPGTSIPAQNASPPNPDDRRLGRAWMNLTKNPAMGTSRDPLKAFVRDTTDPADPGVAWLRDEREFPLTGHIVNDTYIHPELMKSISSGRDFSPEASEPHFLNKWPDVKFSPQERPWEYGSKKFPQTAELTDDSKTLVWPGHGHRSVANMEEIYSHFPKNVSPTYRQEQWFVEKAKPILAGANRGFLQQLDPQIADDLVGHQSQALYDKYLELKYQKDLDKLEPKGPPPK